MTVWIFLSGIIAPAIFWICYFYYKDRFKPEPIQNLGLAYILGFAAGFICSRFYTLFPLIGITDYATVLMSGSRIEFLGYNLVFVGLVEEFFKYLPFTFIIIKFKEFDEKIDGIIYASVIALGFASFENLGYLTRLKGFELIGRAFASPLTHSIFASIWGYAVGAARIGKKSILKASVAGLLLASFIHGIFNFFTASSVLRIISAVLILVFWIWRIKILEKEKSA